MGYPALFFVQWFLSVFYVYVLAEQSTGDNYIGFTGDLKRRVEEHKSQTGSGAKLTSTGTWHLVYYEAYMSKADAVLRERRLKQHGNARKQLLKRIEKSIHCVKISAGEAPDRSPNKRRP